MFGVPHDRAVAMAGWADEVMVESILDRCTARPWTWAGSGARRSATSPNPAWSLIPSEDPFLSAEGARAAAVAAGAPVTELAGSDTGGCCRTPPGGRPP